jgi:hypothetical protein
LKLHNAAALLLCGWYLMGPPTQDTGAPAYASEPLSAWSVWASYDSAKECMQSRERANDALRLSLARKAQERLLKDDLSTRPRAKRIAELSQ